MRDDEAAALQAKLKNAGKTAAAFEQQTAELFKSVGNLDRRRVELETDVKLKRAKLAEKDAEIAQVHAALRSLRERQDAKKKEAKEISDKLRLVEKEFHSLLGKTKSASTRNLALSKKIEKKLQSQDLAVERGYTCTRN
jgi:chromosome segregation ATPase